MNKASFDLFDPAHSPLMVGPNCLRILKELTEKAPLDKAVRILDLGCGMGLSALFLANRTNATIFATDLWVDPAENYDRFLHYGMENRIIPLHAKTSRLPFAGEYFDAIVSIDAYHYFGAEAEFLEKRILPFLKKDGLLLVGVPGLKHDFDDGVPEELEPFWQDDMNFYSAAWWRSLWSSASGVSIEEASDLSCHKAAWEDWLACENPYAKSDREMIKAEAGRYFSTIGLIARKTS